MKVLILGSGPDVIEAKSFKANTFDKIISINNAWQVIENWDFCIFPNDFPKERRPINYINKELITYREYVPIQNKFGGFVYAGGTMAFTAGYWALGKLKPTLISYLGCDMIYKGKNTHFYGKGTADPLRRDPTLKDLLAKSARLEVIANVNNCSVFNLSRQKESKLVFRRINIKDLFSPISPRVINYDKYLEALRLEEKLGYFVEDGKYWKKLSEFNPAYLDKLDLLWKESI